MPTNTVRPPLVRWLLIGAVGAITLAACGKGPEATVPSATADTEVPLSSAGTVPSSAIAVQPTSPSSGTPAGTSVPSTVPGSTTSSTVSTGTHRDNPPTELINPTHADWLRRPVPVATLSSRLGNVAGERSSSCWDLCVDDGYRDPEVTLQARLGEELILRWDREDAPLELFVSSDDRYDGDFAREVPTLRTNPTKLMAGQVPGTTWLRVASVWPEGGLLSLFKLEVVGPSAPVLEVDGPSGPCQGPCAGSSAGSQVREFILGVGEIHREDWLDS